MAVTIFTKAPEQVVTNGQFNFGRFQSPIREVNMLDADVKPTFLKDLQLREWQAFQILTSGYFFFGALYNTKKVGLVQFIVYDIEQRKRIRYERKVAPWEIKLPNGLYGSKARFRSPNCYVQISHDLDQHLMDIEIDIKVTRKTPAIYANLKAEHNVERYTPMVACLPFSKQRGMYSHKCLMPVKGAIEFGASSIELQAENSNLILDDHKGFYPYITKYDWATGLGFSETGQRMGFNLTDNQVQDKEKYNENVLWIDGEMHGLPPISFYRPEGNQHLWYIRDESGYVDLTFTPQMTTKLNLNLLIMASKYAAPYGYFNGSIKKNDGQLQMIQNVFGVGEAFYLRG